MAEIKITVDINSAIRNVGRIDQAFDEMNTGAVKADRNVGNVDDAINKAGREVDDFGKESVQAFAKVDGGLDQIGVGGIAMGNILADAFSRVLDVASRLPGQIFDLATAAEETGSKFRTVLGPAVKQASDFLDEFANKAGLSEVAGQELVSRTAAIAQGFGFAQQESADFAEEVVRLSGDLTSFNDVPIEQSSNAIITALSGEREALKTLGIVIRETEVQERALIQTGKESADQLTQQEKATATFALITERAGVAVGDLDRTQGSAANRARRLSAQMDDVASKIAQRLLPAINTIQELLIRFAESDFFSSLIDGAVDAADTVSKFASIFANNFELITKVLGSVTATALAYRLALQLVATWQALSASGSLTFAAALKVLRGALISTGIGAVIVALGTLVGVLATSTEAWNGFKQMVMGVLELFKNVFTNLPELVSAVFDVITARAVQFGFESYDAIISFFNDLVNTLPEFKENVYNFFEAIIESVVKTFERGFKIAKAFFSNPIDFDISNFAKAGFDAGAAFANQFGGEAKKTQVAIKNTEEAARKLEETLQKTGVAGSIGTIAEGGSQFGSGVMNSFNSGGEGGQALGSGEEEGMNSFDTFTQQLKAEDQAYAESQANKTAAHLRGVKERIESSHKELTAEQKANKKRHKITQSRIKQSLALAETQADNAKDAAKSMANNIRKTIQALIAEGVAGAASKALSSVPFPFNIAAAAAAATAATTLFNMVIPAFATGTTDFKGGTALVGEEGPELVTLGKGSNVITNENTNKLIDAGVVDTGQLSVNAESTPTKAENISESELNEIRNVRNVKNVTDAGTVSANVTSISEANNDQSTANTNASGDNAENRSDVTNFVSENNSVNNVSSFSDQNNNTSSVTDTGAVSANVTSISKTENRDLENRSELNNVDVSTVSNQRLDTQNSEAQENTESNSNSVSNFLNRVSNQRKAIDAGAVSANVTSISEAQNRDAVTNITNDSDRFNTGQMSAPVYSITEAQSNPFQPINVQGGSVQTAGRINTQIENNERSNTERLNSVTREVGNNLNGMAGKGQQQQVDVSVEDIVLEGEQLRIVLQNNDNLRKVAGIA